MNNDSVFPTIKRTISDFINDEDATITRGKLLTVGTMMVVLSVILALDAAAKHTSHRSHSSHSSHSSTSYHRSHSSHSSHTSHSSSSHYSHGSHSNTHSSHSSHTSHSNVASHSNSNYSAAGDLDIPAAPIASSIKVPITAPNTTSSSNLPTSLPTVTLNNINTPEPTQGISELTALSVPLATPEFDVYKDVTIQKPVDNVNTPPKIDQKLHKYE